MLKNYHGAFHSTVSDNENLDEDENLLEELDDKQLVSRISNMEVQEQALKEKVHNISLFILTRKNWRLRRHFCSLRLQSDKSCGLKFEYSQ